MNRQNQLDQRAVDASSISTFKECFGKISETMMGFFMDCSADLCASPVVFLVGEYRE